MENFRKFFDFFFEFFRIFSPCYDSRKKRINFFFIFLPWIFPSWVLVKIMTSNRILHQGPTPHSYILLCSHYHISNAQLNLCSQILRVKTQILTDSLHRVVLHLKTAAM